MQTRALTPEDDRRPAVLFVGLATVDVLHGVDRVPGDNEKIVAAWQEVCAGGPATNAAVTCAHFGAMATLATAVGTHPLGEIIRRDLTCRGVALIDLAADLDAAPPVSSVLVSRRTGKRAVVSANAGAWRGTLAPVPDAGLDEVAVLLVDGHHMATALDVAARARHRGITTVMDGGSWKPGTHHLLGSIDVAICSADFRPPGCETPHAVAAFLRGFGVRAVAISRGADPVLCWEDGQHTAVPVPRVEVIDTLGAGDVLHGAFCHVAAGSAGMGSFLPAIEAAVGVASRSCAHRGTRAWLDADHLGRNSSR